MTTHMKTRERGYSLAEVMVATAIFAIIILAALMIYDRSNRVFKRGVESSNMQQNTRVAFEKLTADLRMTGFDFDRDGIPTGSTGGGNVYQQTDEQFEYIGPSAITIRGNLDYETENAPCDATTSVTENCDNGREGTNATDPTKSYESSQFPVVTTGNDEIVTYALVPSNQTTAPACDTATNCIQFYADTHLPRSSYPGGNNENLVQIKGVDLCTGGCNNPPYNLTRFTLERDQSDFSSGSHVTATPLATNIRSMQFTYYQDAQGTDPLKDLNNATDVSTGAAIKGEGQWKQNNPGALVVNREIRTKINSVRLTLIGMNEQEDRAFTDANETVNAVKNFRKYRLETLIAPRNIQKRGMKEQDTYAPTAPQNVHVCMGYCGGVYVYWDAPTVSSVAGAPDQYKISYGPDVSGGGTPCDVTVYTNLSAYVFNSTNCGAIQPNTQYKFRVVAVNSYGSASSNEVTGVIPLNFNKPDPPTAVTASTGDNGKITLTWNRPTTSVTQNFSCTPSGSVPTGAPYPAGEVWGYRVQRSPDGTTGSWVDVGTGTTNPAVSVQSPLDTVTWSDTTVENCKTYFYRVRTVELCRKDPLFNNPNDDTLGQSNWTAGVSGSATSNVAPNPPIDLVIDQVGSMAALNCNGLGQCQPIMKWPKVTSDANGAPISVLHYKVYRRDLPSGAWAVENQVDVTTPAAGQYEPAPPDYPNYYVGPMLGVSAGQQYEFQVTAVQCPPAASGESTYSPVRKWPCTLAAGATGTMTAPGAFDGNGSAGTPWLFASDASVTVTVPNSSTVTGVTFRRYDASGAFIPGTEAVDTAAPYTYAWTVGQGQTEGVTATIADTSGCVGQVQGFVQDEDQGCCLEPVTLDPSTLVFSAGNNYVDIYLRNICSGDLAMNSVTVSWDQSITGNAGKLQSVSFPLTAGGFGTVSLGGSISPPETVSAPSGTKVVDSTDTNYRIRLTFGKNLSQQPVTAFSATYVNNAAQATCPVITSTP